MRARSLLSILVLSLLFEAHSALAQATSTAATTSVPEANMSWPEGFYQSVINGYNELKLSADNLKVRFVNALFYSTTDISLFRTGIGRDVSLGMGIKREVYNNYDVINSFTVIDRIHLNMGNHYWGTGSQNDDYVAPSGPTVGFIGVNLGANGSIEVRDMTQLTPSDMTTHPTLEQKKSSLQKLMNSDDNGDNTPTEPGDIQDINPYINTLNLDSSLSVKLHRIWNPATLPFRLPLSRTDMRYLKDGEIISYNLSGQLGFGGTVGFNVSPVPGVTAGVDFNVETHLNGEFEVSIQREDQRHARVRVSKINGHGSSANAEVGIHLNGLLKGLFVIKPALAQNAIDEESFSIVPFSAQLAHQDDHEVDIAYEYDLDSDEGKDAFHHAVLGNLIVSDETAKTEKNNPRPAVTKLFERNSDTDRTSAKRGLNLSFFYTASKQATQQSIQTQIEFPDGTKRLFKSTDEDERDTRNMRHSDRTLKRITVMMDRDGFANQKSGSLVLIGENMLDDSSTKAKSMNEYASEVETFFQDMTLFPNFPLKTPALDGYRPRKIHYGRSSFYYGVNFKEDEIHTFLNTAVETLEASAKNIGIRFNHSALEDAKAALDARDADKLYTSLTRLFTDHRHAGDFMQWILTTQDMTKIDKFLVAQNAAFGTVQNRGPHISAIEQTFNETDKNMGIQSDVNRSSPDPTAVIKDLSSKENSNKQIELHFNLENDPEFLFFRLTPLTHSHSGDEAAELTVYNRNKKFVKGENTIVLDPDSTDPLIHHLTDRLDSNEIVMLTMGYTQKNQKWGPGSTTQFATGQIYAQPTPSPTPKEEKKKKSRSE